jgi:hypothetical protein
MINQFAVCAVVLSLSFSLGANAQEATSNPASGQRFETTTRAQVHTETLDSLAKGRVQGGEATNRTTEMYFPQRVSLVGREQVVEQLCESKRLGINDGGEATYFATESELDQLRLAGQRNTSNSIRFIASK